MWATGQGPQKQNLNFRFMKHRKAVLRILYAVDINLVRVTHNEIVHFGVRCVSFCKFSPDRYADCMQCVSNDTNITSTGHSRDHPPTPIAHFSPDLR